MVCAVNYTVPRGHCFKCFNLRFPMVSKDTKDDTAPTRTRPPAKFVMSYTWRNSVGGKLRENRCDTTTM